MEEYTNTLKDYLGIDRSWGKNMYKIMATLYRGVTKGRFTYEEGLKKLNNLGGMCS